MSSTHSPALLPSRMRLYQPSHGGLPICILVGQHRTVFCWGHDFDPDTGCYPLEVVIYAAYREAIECLALCLMQAPYERFDYESDGQAFVCYGRQPGTLTDYATTLLP